MAPIFKALIKICVTLITVTSMIHSTTSVPTLVSDYLKSVDVIEGGNAIFNCTFTGRQNANDRLTWHVDWNPTDALQGRDFPGEANTTLTNSHIPPGHGIFSFEYILKGTGTDPSDVHMCLLRISGVTFDDRGDYLCSYFNASNGRHSILGQKATLFVLPNSNIALPTSQKQPTTHQTIHQSSPTTLPSGGDNDSQDGGSGATTAAIIVVLIVIIIILVSVWSIFRYRRYRKDKQTDIPTELPTIETATTSNSYRDVNHNGSAHCARNIVITDDVAGVRLPPSIESGDPPPYSSLNRPDSQIREHFGGGYPSYPEETNQDYVITTIGSPDPEQPPLPAKSSSSKQGHTSRDSDSSEEKPPLPSRSSSASQAPKMKPSDTPGYEIVEPNFTPRTPNDSIYLSPSKLAYQQDDEYEAVNPET